MIAIKDPTIFTKSELVKIARRTSVPHICDTMKKEDMIFWISKWQEFQGLDVSSQYMQERVREALQEEAQTEIEQKIEASFGEIVVEAPIEMIEQKIEMIEEVVEIAKTSEKEISQLSSDIESEIEEMVQDTNPTENAVEGENYCELTIPKPPAELSTKELPENMPEAPVPN